MKLSPRLSDKVSLFAVARRDATGETFALQPDCVPRVSGGTGEPSHFEGVITGCEHRSQSRRIKLGSDSLWDLSKHVWYLSQSVTFLYQVDLSL